MRKTILSLLVLCFPLLAVAQIGNTGTDYNQIDESGNITTGRERRDQNDSTEKEIPKGIYVWTIDRRFGDRTTAQPDTLSHMFMNGIFTSGLRGEYNTTGNLGSPRQHRIFIDRTETDTQFPFINVYDFFVTDPSQFHFTNTLSPFTNLSYNTCGNRTNGEDHFTARFGVNAGKKIGVGFKFDYLYGRGYYSNQSTSHFNYTLYGSYLGDRYEAHFLASTNHQKITENGGITNDNYITHPEIFNESFQTSEIPTMLARNWNRNDNQHVLFSHRYNVGYNRKVPMTQQEIDAKKFAIASRKEAEARKLKEETERKARGESSNDDNSPATTFAGRPEGATVVDRTVRKDSLGTDSTTAVGRIAVTSKAMADSILQADRQAAEDTSWMKKEYVPVTSFIHTLEVNNYRRIYQAYETPENFYLDNYTVAERFSNDSIYDKTSHWSLRNTFAISMLEGFNKWAKAGLKAFLTHELRHFSMPDATADKSWSENALSVGGQLAKTQGRTLHYHALAQFGLVGVNLGELHLDGGFDLNLPILRDTMTLKASAFYHHEKPAFYYRHFQSRHFWWDNDDLSMTDHLRIQGTLSSQKTRTRLCVAYDIINNYTYLTSTYTVTDDYRRINNAVAVGQSSDAVSIFTAQAAQDLTFGPLNWESVVTVQKSTSDRVLPLPLVNVYTNLYLRFKIARVLKCDFGADLRYFTRYKASEYVPALGQFAVQGNDSKVELGNYPIANVYANFHLKQTRFFVMMSHANAGSGKKNYFLTPHYPLNGSVLRFGLSWNFYN